MPSFGFLGSRACRPHKPPTSFHDCQFCTGSHMACRPHRPPTYFHDCQFCTGSHMACRPHKPPTSFHDCQFCTGSHMACRLVSLNGMWFDPSSSSLIRNRSLTTSNSKLYLYSPPSILHFYHDHEDRTPRTRRLPDGPSQVIGFAQSHWFRVVVRNRRRHRQ